MKESYFFKKVRNNCDISDARDNGIYSLCTLVLKLRNLYKWEHGLQPWEEPESAELLDWIAAKEEYWETISGDPFQHLPVNGKDVDPFSLQSANEMLAEAGQVYGAGYGRSMKAVFFIAKMVERKSVEGCPVIILGHESARELSSPFAMLQDGIIYIRKEPMRFYFWDHIQETIPSCKSAKHHVLDSYGVLNEDLGINHNLLVEKFDSLIDRETDIFIYHEVGEMHENVLDSATLKKIIHAFPDSAIELLSRSVKDILADTHEKGLISHIVVHRKKSSLGFYRIFLDGMRKMLWKKCVEACTSFWDNENWDNIEKARQMCRKETLLRAEKLNELSRKLDTEEPEGLKEWTEKELLVPLGLQAPDSGGDAT
jgi:hypothetical protein